MSENDETLYYTYLDECKRNYLTDVMKSKNPSIFFEEYSITSLTFDKDLYQTKFEMEWENFRKKYNMDSQNAMHFIEYKKLINPENRNSDNIGYSTFLVNDVFSEDHLKSFFKDLKTILEDNEFFIVHTDYYWKKHRFLTERKKFSDNQVKKMSRNVAPTMLNNVPYVAMRKHLDSLLQSLLKRYISDVSDVEDGYYLDCEVSKKVYTKLRFDADGKQFDAKSDLKKAYNHTIAIGSDNVQSKIATEVLDEIRFIRKEEVGHDYVPNHCGLEVVDFLCSMIAGETRLLEYLNIGALNDLDEIKEGSFANLHFNDGTTIDFYEIIARKIQYHTINFLKY